MNEKKDPVRQPGDTSPDTRSLNAAAPMGAIFDGLFRSRSAALKIGGAALATPLIVASHLLRSKNDPTIAALTPTVVAVTLLLCAAGGALIGTCLVLKDLVERRAASGQHVPAVLDVFFGLGMFSILAVWFPLVIAATIAAIWFGF